MDKRNERTGGAGPKISTREIAYNDGKIIYVFFS